MTARDSKINWFKILILCIGGGTIYTLPYLRYGYYDAMIEAFSITNVQLGALGAIYGAFFVPSQIFGGFLADIFSAKKMLLISFIATAVLGLCMMTMPSYGVLLGIHALLGISTSLTFWPAFQAITRYSAPADQVGSVYGYVTGGRKVMSMLVAMVGVWVFTYYQTDQIAGLQMVLAVFSAFLFVVAILFFFFFKEAKQDREADKADKFSLKDVKRALSMPTVWILAIGLHGIYGVYRSGDFFTPYMTQVVGVGAALGAIIGYSKSYAITPIGSAIAGYISDKVGRVNFVLVMCICAVLFDLLFLVIPGGSSIRSYLVVGNIILFMASIWAAYTLIYSMLDDTNVPARLTGTCIGIIGIIGFIPEITSPLIGGAILDAFGDNKETAFNWIWIQAAFYASIAIISFIVFKKYATGLKEKGVNACGDPLLPEE